MPKWGIFNASLLLNEHGHPLFYFKIEVIMWQIFSGQSLNKNLLSLLFQRNYLKCTIIRYMAFTLVKTHSSVRRKYRLVRDFIFIILNEVSWRVLLRCTRTDTFVNKFSNLSALVAQTFLSSCWDSTWFMIIRWRLWRCFLSSWRVDSSFGITWFLINSLKMFARKLISRKACRPTRSENV